MKRKERNGGRQFQPVQRRTGFLGMCGEKVVAREWLQARIHECEEAIDRERHEVFEHGIARSYFVLFETQVQCLITVPHRRLDTVWACVFVAYRAAPK